MLRSAAGRPGEIEDLRLNGHVERGRWLVGEQQRRAAGEGDGDRDPLTHAARELVRILLQATVGLGDADVGEEALGRRHRLPFAAVEVGASASVS